MSRIALPRTVDALIDMLDTSAFPLKTLPVTATVDEVHRHFGTRDAVDFLRALQRERDEAIHERSITFDGDE
ncbi:hypothetical protein [Reyranella sp.]|uniref:hypothetical protein n=1 Tax=Reyranella sp. TaxID=1929291 RepID=UPI003D15253A